MSIDYLEPLKLGQYAARFDDLGYEDWEDLADVKLDKLQADFGMKQGHAVKLRKWLDKRSTAASEPDRPSLAPSLPADLVIDPRSLVIGTEIGSGTYSTVYRAEYRADYRFGADGSGTGSGEKLAVSFKQIKQQFRILKNG